MNKTIYIIGSIIILNLQFLVSNSFAQLWDTFESYNTQAEADASWVSTDVNMVRVDIANDELDFNMTRNLSSDLITHDLGAGNVSDNKWTLRFNITFNSTVAGIGARIYIGLSDNTLVMSGVQDFIGVIIVNDNSELPPGSQFGSIDTQNSGYVSQTEDNRGNLTVATATTYFFEIIRQTTTTYVVRRYTDNTYTTIATSANGSCSNLTQNLRYIKVSHMNQSTHSGSLVGNIDDVQFCNNTTTFNCNPTPLPLEFLSFSAKWQDEMYNTAVLEWQTANEINNDYFEIERSIDGVNFSTIMQVNGLNNSSKITDYQELDTSPYRDGVSYYKLKQVDNDGTFSYSQIEALNVPDGLKIINLYPNPVSDLLNFSILSSLNAEVDIKITNALGQIILTTSKGINKGLNQITINLPNIGDGNYYLQVSMVSGEYRSQQKFIVNQKD